MTTSTSLTARAALEEAIHQVAPEADLDGVSPDESLRAALDLDSLDFLAIVERLAERTGVTVPESDYLTVDSLDGFVAYLAARMSP